MSCYEQTKDTTSAPQVERCRLCRHPGWKMGSGWLLLERVPSSTPSLNRHTLSFFDASPLQPFSLIPRRDLPLDEVSTGVWAIETSGSAPCVRAHSLKTSVPSKPPVEHTTTVFTHRRFNRELSSPGLCLALPGGNVSGRNNCPFCSSSL